MVASCVYLRLTPLRATCIPLGEITATPQQPLRGQPAGRTHRRLLVGCLLGRESRSAPIRMIQFSTQVVTSFWMSSHGSSAKRHWIYASSSALAISRARNRHQHLIARMIAECMPSATWRVGVMVMSVNPAVASPWWYSATVKAPAMQPT